MEDQNPNQAEANSLVGSKLDDRYEILSAIASGGMGVVFRGRHILMDKIVAIKMLNAAFSNEPDAYARFQNEAKIACQLSHPNIVTVHDFGIVNEKMYLVMDFVEGKTLGDVLDDETFLPVSRVINIAMQICDALQYAHEQGLIHRDLKAENIMLLKGKDGSDQAKILDFGLAKFFGEGKQQALSASGFMMGTAYYMSPEQCKGKKADIRSEMYSLACVLYEALCGVPPLVGENVLETVQKHIDETPVPVSEVRPELGIPREVEAIISRGLNKKPDERFQSASEFRQALEKLSAAEESAVTPRVSTVTGNNTTPVASDPATDSTSNALFLKIGLVVAAIVIFLMLLPLSLFSSLVLQKPQSSSPVSTNKQDTRAPSVLWMRHYKNAVVAFDEEKYDDAEKALRLAILAARRTGGKTELLQALRKQQDVLYVQRKFSDADALDAEIMRLTAAGASDVPSTAAEDPAKTSKIAGTSDHSKNSEESDSFSPSGSSSNPQDERIAKLAMFCHKRGQCNTAIQLLQHSVEVSKRINGVNSLKTAERLQELASLHIALDENDKAQPIMEQVMEIKSAVARKNRGTK